MGTRDLTNLQNVKTYLGLSTGESDAFLQQRITAMSAAFVSEIGREILRRSYSETLDGDDERIRRIPTGFSFLASGWGVAINLNGPVIGDPVLTIDGVVVPKRTTLSGSGWVLLDRYRLELVDYNFTRLIGNVSIAYEAGEWLSEAVTGAATVTAGQALGTFYSDIGVTYVSSGTALTKTAGVPSAGQYAVSATGVYTFNAADVGVALSLSYAYLPADVEDCVIEMVAHKFRKRERLDHLSENLGGQSVFFAREAWPVTVQNVLDGWTKPLV